MPTNSRDAFIGQSRSPNMVPFDRLGMVADISISVVVTAVGLFRLKYYYLSYETISPEYYGTIGSKVQKDFVVL